MSAGWDAAAPAPPVNGNGSAPEATADGPSLAQDTRSAGVTKIYIGGLPDPTREEDLHDCFSQLGAIRQIELKRGFGFVEYDNAQSATDAVAKYHEGSFLGSPIKVELSHGGRKSDMSADICFECKKVGHWSRDCPRRRMRESESGRGELGRQPAEERMPPRDIRERSYDRDGRDSYSASTSLRDPYERPSTRDPYEARYDRAAPAPPRDDYYGRRESQPARNERDYDDRRAPAASYADERDRRYREPARDLRDRFDARGPPLPAAPPSRDPYVSNAPPARDYNDDYRRGDAYAKPQPPADPYDYASRESYDRRPPADARHAAAQEPSYATSRSTYDDRAPRQAYDDRASRQTYDDRSSRQAYDDRASRQTYDDRASRAVYDDRPSRLGYEERAAAPRYDDRSRPPPAEDRYGNRYPRQADPRDAYGGNSATRERSPPRRNSRRSLSPARRGDGLANPAYAAAAPAQAPYNGYASAGSQALRGGPPPPADDYRRRDTVITDAYDRRGPPSGYAVREAYGGRR